MEKEIYIVGIYIDDVFNILAVCTSYKNAEKAVFVLRSAGYDEIEIESSKFRLDALSLNENEIDLTIE